MSYSNEMKTSVLGVADETLRTHGAVSHQCARDMAIGAARVGKAHARALRDRASWAGTEALPTSP